LINAPDKSKIANIIDVFIEGVISIDEHHKITYLNLSIESMLGYSANELIGQKLNKIIPTEFHQTHESDIAKFAASSRDVRPMSMNRDKSFIMLTKNKTRVPVLIAISKGQVDGSNGFSAVVSKISGDKSTNTDQPEMIGQEESETIFRNIGNQKVGIGRQVNENDQKIKLRHENILIVDDDPFILKHLKFTLKEYNIKTVENGFEALRLIKESRPNLIIVDILMPVIDGYALIQKLKKKHETRMIPVILLTGNQKEEDKVKGLRKGADYYITKPVNIEELKVVIRNLLNKNKDFIVEEISKFVNTKDNKSFLDKDIQFLNKFYKTVKKHLSDKDLNVEKLGEILNINRRSMERMTRKLIGMSPNQSIMIIRMNFARLIIREHPNYPISAIANQVGIKNTSYFIKVFRKSFGFKPSEVAIHSSNNSDNV